MNKDNNLPQNSGNNATSNPKNSTWEQYSNNAQSSKDKQAAKLFENLSFADEWGLLYNGAKVTQLVCGLASAGSLFICFYFAFSLRFPSSLSAALSLVICGLVEVFKAFSWSKLAKYILKYKKYPFALLAFAVGLNTVSVSGSAIGAYLTPSKTNQSTQNSAYTPPVNVDSIAQHYEHKAANMDAAISAYTKEIEKTSSNSTKRTLSKNIEDFTTAKAKFSEHGREAIAAAKEDNSKALAAFEQHSNEQATATQNSSKRLRTVAVCLVLLFEFLLVGAYGFASYYLFRLHIDTTNGATEQRSQPQEQPRDISTAQQRNSQQEESSYQPPNVARPASKKRETRRKIGFGQAQPPTTPTTPKTPTATEQRSKDCDHCGRSFEYKNDSAQYCGGKCRNRAYRARKKLTPIV